MKWDRNLYHALMCSFSAVYTGTQRWDLYVGPMRQPRERRELVGVCVCVYLYLCGCLYLCGYLYLYVCIVQSVN